MSQAAHQYNPNAMRKAALPLLNVINSHSINKTVTYSVRSDCHNVNLLNITTEASCVFVHEVEMW